MKGAGKVRFRANVNGIDRNTSKGRFEVFLLIDCIFTCISSEDTAERSARTVTGGPKLTVQRNLLA